MNFMTKHQLLLKAMVFIVAMAFAATGFSANLGSARIIPDGKVSIIRNGKVVGEISKEAPLPEGSLLRCQGKCTVKMNDLYAVTEPDTTFSVQPMAARNELTVKQGTTYFSVSETSRPLAINSPAGNATMREVSVTGSKLRGYVRVVGNKMEIGVIDGGSMTVLTSSGEMAITPGKKITIARSNPATPKYAGGESGVLGISSDVVLGVVGAGVIVGGTYALNESIAGDGNNDGSPSAP